MKFPSNLIQWEAIMYDVEKLALLANLEEERCESSNTFPLSWSVFSSNLLMRIHESEIHPVHHNLAKYKAYENTCTSSQNHPAGYR